MFSQLKLGLSLSIFCFGIVYAQGERADLSDFLQDLMECTSERYVQQANPEIAFDIDAHGWAWEQCQSIRDAFVSTFPDAQRLEWEVRLERIRASMIEALQPSDPGTPGYGLSPKDPVMVGGLSDGPRRTQEYFSRLRGPSGEPPQVRRLGSCCRFPTKNASIGTHGVLDKYELFLEVSSTPITVYVNIYDEGQVIPVEGFTLESGT